MCASSQLKKSVKSVSTYIAVLTLLLALCNGLCAQQTVIDWEENLGGSDRDLALAIKQTNDGGYVVAGRSESSDGDVGGNQGKSDYWIVKLNPSGQIEWENNLGGSELDVASDIEQTNDGGYVVAGESYSSDGDVGGNQGSDDYWIVKLNQSGQLEWEENFGGVNRDEAHDIEQTNDGGYIVAGDSWSSDGDVGGNQGIYAYWIVKLNPSGQIEWEENFGGSNDDLAHDIEQTNDGGFIVTGDSHSSDGDVGGNQGSDDYWIVKLNQSGQLEWEENLGGTGDDRAKDIEQTNDGGFIVAGHSYSSDGDVEGNQGSTDYWIVKLNPSGQIEWENNLGGSKRDVASDIEQTNDGGFIVTGNSRSSDGDVGGNKGNNDYWIVKLNQSCQLEWEENLGGTRIDLAFDIEQSNDGGYIVAGHSKSYNGDVGGNQGRYDYWIVRFGNLNLGPDTTLCGGDSLTLGPIQFPADSIGWSTGETGDSIVVSDSGVYHVTVKSDTNTYFDTVEVATAPRPHVYIGPNEQAFCGKIDHTFNPETKHANTFRWNTGDTTKTLHVDQEGTYWLRVEGEDACANADTSELQALQTPKGFANEQIAVCEGAVELDAGNPDASSFKWNTGQTTRKIRVDKEDTYTVKISNDYCAIKDTIKVRLNEDSECPYLYMPNAFTPDGDGLNDVFKPGYQNIRDFRMAIYNRWGAQVFETKDITEGWDGTHKGSKVPQGQYLYNISYRYKEEGIIRTNTKSGILQVNKH